MMTKEFVKKLTTTTTFNPYLSAPTADAGAQVIILGHNHLSRIGLTISSLHHTAAVLDITRRGVEFAGYIITEDGIKPAAKYNSSIRDFPNPRKIPKVRA